MDETRVLVLNLDTEEGLGTTLREILERNGRIAVHHQMVEPGDWKPDYSALVECYDPAIVFLILSQALVEHSARLVQPFRKSTDQPLIVVASRSEPDQIFEMLKQGASDFITPPLTRESILPRLWRLLHGLEGKSAPGVARHAESLRKLVGQSKAFVDQLNRIPLVARCDATVLISGETGTGKELFARAIHELSPRSKGPFVAVNCGAIPMELAEGELFGHERGAFTGAHAQRKGLVEEANRGTLFLDEIDSLPLLAQVKLLRFLQEKEYRPLGSPNTRTADVRVITATNIDVENAVRSGRLRHDLYYRLNILPIVLPPLRERRDDILLLAGHFLTRYSMQFEKAVCGFTPEAREALILYPWPGNVRELEHAVARAVAMSESGSVSAAALQLAGADGEGIQSFQAAKAKVVSRFERAYLEGLLLACHGNISRAAQAANKNRRSFWELLRKHRIDAGRFRETIKPALMERAG